MKDKISVIIPVYKTEKYLDKCVKSIVEQTYSNLEIILVDDCSPDKCPQMCDEWAKKDDRIRVLHIENKGVANARNVGLNVAIGDYISFIDSDDYAEPDMLETLYTNIEKNNANISVCGFYGGECVDSILENKSLPEILELIATGEYVYGVLWNKLYKKEIVSNISMPPLACCEDLVFNYFAFKNAGSVAQTTAKKYHYISRSGSVTNAGFSKDAFDAVKSKEIILEDSNGTDLEPYAVKGLIVSGFVVLSGAIKSQKFKSEIKELRNMILSHKKEIYLSPLFPNNIKIKTLVLSISLTLFKNILIKRNNK